MVISKAFDDDGLNLKYVWGAKQKYNTKIMSTHRRERERETETEGERETEERRTDRYAILRE
jgi:hypothetical protein